MDVGDRVRLKSGGPSMVIVRRKRTRALCRWMDRFVHRWRTNDEWFPVATLEDDHG